MVRENPVAKRYDSQFEIGATPKLNEPDPSSNEFQNSQSNDNDNEKCVNSDTRSFKDVKKDTRDFVNANVLPTEYVKSSPGLDSQSQPVGETNSSSTSIVPKCK